MKPKKFAHKALQIQHQVQFWIEETWEGDGGYAVVTKSGLPGTKPETVSICGSVVQARVLMDALIAMLQLNTIEGTMVDVLDIKKGLQ